MEVWSMQLCKSAVLSKDLLNYRLKKVGVYGVFYKVYLVPETK